MTDLDTILAIKYKNMIGLSNIDNNSGNTIFKGNTTIYSALFVSGYSILQGSVSILSSLYVSGLTIYNNNVTINSSLNVSGNMIIQGNNTVNTLLVSGNTNINNNLIVNNNTIFNYDTSFLSSLNVGGNVNVNNYIVTNSIAPLDNNQLNIYGNTINIGTTNSIINILGTVTYIASTQLKITDKLISLNVTNNSGFINDSSYCGIEILGISGNGFIRTSADGSRYEIKAPLDPEIRYIATVNSNEDLNISGYSIFQNNVSLLSDLNVYNTALLQGQTTIVGNLNVANDTICNNNVSIISFLYVSGSTFINNSLTILSNLYLNNNLTIGGDTTINSNLSVSGNSLFQNDVTINSSLTVSGNTIIQNDTTVLSFVNISSFSIIHGNTTIISGLYVSSNTIINGDTTIKSNINVKGKSIILGNATISSNLAISGNAILQGNITLGNSSILGQIVNQLPHYDTNLAAASAGVSIWGFYRTGGIVKIRLDIIPPTFNLNNITQINTNISNTYTDPGIYATDDDNSNVIPYLISVKDINMIEYLDQPIAISNNTIVTLNNTLTLGTYQLLYQATDIIGNSSTITRTLNVTY